MYRSAICCSSERLARFARTTCSAWTIGKPLGERDVAGDPDEAAQFAQAQGELTGSDRSAAGPPG